MPISSCYTKAKAIEYLFSLEKYGIKFGLQRINAILKSLGNPQDKLNIIHVGGTNGKGSTSAMIASMLTKAGYRAGLYTSPHLVKFNERIRINGKEITDRKIAELVEIVRNVSLKVGAYGHTPLQSTFFEFTTAMAFLYFAEEKVDFAVMEVGLGGRLDATNVGDPLVSIITNIAKDHEAILGKKIIDIAFEKAGIIKKGGILISAETKPAALKVLKDECKKKRAVLYRLDRDFFIDENIRGKGQGARGKKENHFAFRGRRWLYKDLSLNLSGRHQYLNTACALAAMEVLEEKGYTIPESAIRDGLKYTFWPGRFEIMSQKPMIVLDCAHNPAGAEALKKELRFAIYDLRMKNKKNNSKIENRKAKIILVLGIMADKDIKGILSRLAPLANIVIVTRPKTERAASVKMLYSKIMQLRITNYELRIKNRKSKIANRKLQIMPIEDVEDACRTALSMCGKEDMICITGSVFTVGEAREALRQLHIAK